MAEPLQVNDEEQTPNDPVVLTQDEIATQAVPADEQLAQETQKIEDLPTTSSGIPRITIAPVTPQPEAGVDKSTSTFSLQKTAPYIRVSEPKDLKPRVEEDLARKAEATEPQTYESVMKRLEAGETVVLGNKTYVGRPTARVIKNNAEERVLLKGQIAQYGMPGEVQEDQPTIAFTDPAASSVVLPQSMTDPDERDLATTYAESRMAVNSMLQQTIPNRNVRQIIVDNYISGDFVANLSQRVAEQGRGFAVGIPLLGMDIYGVTDALTDHTQKGINFFDAWEAREPERERRRQKFLESVDSVLSGPTLAMHFNNEVNRIAKERFENGTITKEQYEDIAFVKVGGELVPKEHFDEDTAYQLMDMAFNEMPKLLQVATMVTENAFTGGFYGATKAFKGGEELKRLKKIIASDNTLAGLTYDQAIKELKSRDINFKVNQKLLDIGIGQEKVSDQLAAASVKIQQSNKKLDELRLNGLENSVEYKIEMSNRDNLQRMRNRAVFSGKTRPYLAAGSRDAFVVSAGQFYSRELLGDSIDPGAAEALGFIGMAAFGGKDLTLYLGSKFAAGSKSLVGVSGRTALRVTPDWLGSNVTLIGRLANKAIPLGDTTVNDYERLVFKPRNGRRMTMGERAALQRTVDSVKDMRPENRDELYDAISRVNELTDRILNAFDTPAERMEAERLFQLTLGQATGISLTAAARAEGTLSLKSLKKEGLDILFETSRVQQEQIRRTQIALENFANHVENFADINKSGPIKALVRKLEDMITEQQVQLNNDLNIIDENLDTFIEAASADIIEGVDENFIQDLIKMKIGLKESLQKVIDEEQAIKEVNKAWSAGTERRLQLIENLRRNRLKHRNATSRLLEDLMYARLNQLTARGDAAYSDLGKFINDTNRPGVDIAPAVEKMMSIAYDGESDIMFMFGRDGVFFNSPVGRRAQDTFDKMAVRAFNSIDDDFKTFLEGKLIEDFEIPADEIVRLQSSREGRVQFALMAHATGAINIFGNVSLVEADVLRRAFRDYGYKVKKSNPTVGERFGDFAKTLDDLIDESDPEGFQKLLEAREKYAIAVGDTMREGGTFYRLKQSRKGGEKRVLSDDAPTKNFYRTFKPTDLFNDVIENVDKLSRRLNERQMEKTIDDLNQAVAEVMQEFADPVDGKLVFDLTTPEGKQYFDVLRKTVTESLQDRWFADYIAAVRKDRVGARIQPEETYNFKRSQDLEFINNAATVLVKVPGKAEPISVPIMDLDSLYKFERIQLDRLEEGTQLARGFKQFQTRAKQQLTSIKNFEKAALPRRGQAIESIKSLANAADGATFFERYIQGTGEDIDVLRDLFINNSISQGIGVAEAEKAFDEGVKALIFQGILSRGAYRVSQEAKEVAFDGSTFMAKTFHDTGSLLETLRNEDVREQLLSVFDPDHLQYLDDVATFMHLQGARAMVLSGNVKGISTTEALSRAYNIARQMVSPLYVGSEVALRIMHQMGAETLFMALDNKDSARIMNNLLNFPELVTKQDLDKFDSYLMQFMVTHALRTGQEALVRQYLDVNPFDGDEDEQETEASTSGQ